jgi:hypothetical protein
LNINDSNAASLNSSQYRKIYKKFKKDRYEPVPTQANKETQEPKNEAVNTMRREEKKLDSILVSTMTEIDEDAQELLATKYGV